MATPSATGWNVDSYEEGLELFYEQGWTDGLPVILPTPEKVASFLDYCGLAPDDVVGSIPERNRELTAEKVATNAVMAGCRKEYLPVVIAAAKGVTSPQFEFNHLASMGSPTPTLVVSGPIVKELGFNHGGWLLGPGSRVNASIGRALSLLLWNCAELRPAGIQRGTYGNPLRWASGCVAEDPDPPEPPSLRQYLGFPASDSTVTVHSNCGTYTQVWTMKSDVHDTLNAISDALVAGSGNFNRGVYIVLVAPPIVRRFARAGWKLSDIRQWLISNSGRSLADLKKRGFPPAGEAHRLWRSHGHVPTGDTTKDSIASGVVASGDETQFIKLFEPNGALDELIWSHSQLSRETDVYLVTAGADVAYGCIVMPEYDVSTAPVTVKIEPAQTHAGRDARGWKAGESGR